MRDTIPYVYLVTINKCWCHCMYLSLSDESSYTIQMIWRVRQRRVLQLKAVEKYTYLSECVPHSWTKILARCLCTTCWIFCALLSQNAYLRRKPWNSLKSSVHLHHRLCSPITPLALQRILLCAGLLDSLESPWAIARSLKILLRSLPGSKLKGSKQDTLTWKD